MFTYLEISRLGFTPHSWVAEGLDSLGQPAKGSAEAVSNQPPLGRHGSLLGGGGCPAEPYSSLGGHPHPWPSACSVLTV